MGEAGGVGYGGGGEPGGEGVEGGGEGAGLEGGVVRERFLGVGQVGGVSTLL